VLDCPVIQRPTENGIYKIFRHKIKTKKTFLLAENENEKYISVTMKYLGSVELRNTACSGQMARRM